jgi:pyruvate dehydrogenase E2 component (dihydrolipoyllysine-residue acetyltransferase)
MIDFRMPALGADMESGTLVEWLVKPGDRITSGAIIAVVETQKGAIEVEFFHDGVVSEILIPVGQKVPVGAVLARIDDGAATAAAGPAMAAPEAQRAVEAAPSPPVEERAPAPPPIAPAARVKATPVARRRAAALGIDLARLKGAGVLGAGVEGAICLADVEAAHAKAAERATAPGVKRGFVAAEMRKAIAAAMARSKREIPHYYLGETIDLSAALAWLERFNATQPPPGRLLPAALLLKASALALREAPELNGTFVDNAFVPGQGVHVGWAVSLRGGGLVAPAIRDADRKSLVDTMEAMRDLVGRARSGGLRSSELTSPTVTVTSMGERGAETVIGVIYPPQVAIVGFGRIVQRPWAVDGRLEARPLVAASLAADHRVTDGHRGGVFLAALRDILQKPEAL